MLNKKDWKESKGLKWNENSTNSSEKQFKPEVNQKNLTEAKNYKMLNKNKKIERNQKDWKE